MQVSDAPTSNAAIDQLSDEPVATQPNAIKQSNDRNANATSGQFLLAAAGVPTPAQTAIMKSNVVRQNISDRARLINGDPQLLAAALEGGTLSRAESNALIADLIRGSTDSSSNHAFYGDVQRVSPQQKATIANAVNQAYVDGAINKNDLLNLADVNHAGNGAQSLISQLSASPEASKPGGAIEVLGQALIERANANPNTKQAKLDYFGAAVAFSQSAEIYAANRGTASERVAMFEATVAINEKGYPAYGEVQQDWTNEGIATAGQLYVDNAQLLTDTYTGVPADTAVLSKFFSQTILDPKAQSITLDGGQNLVASINTALGDASATYIDRAANADTQLEREDALHSLGALSASVNGGIAVALTRYSGEIRDNEAFRDQIAGLFNSAISPLMKPIPGPLSSIAGDATKGIGAAIVDQFIQYPDRPALNAATAYVDRMEQSVRQFETDHGFDGLLSAFQSSRAAETLDLQRDLNVNLGGHRN